MVSVMYGLVWDADRLPFASLSGVMIPSELDVEPRTSWLSVSGAAPALVALPFHS